MKMKRMKRTTALKHNGLAVAALGLSLIIGGFVARSANIDIREMFRAGNWSVASVKERTGIQSEADLTTHRERSLLTAFSRTNEQCIGLAELCVEVSNVFLLIGACLLFMGGEDGLARIRHQKRGCRTSRWWAASTRCAAVETHTLNVETVEKQLPKDERLRKSVPCVSAARVAA